VTGEVVAVVIAAYNEEAVIGDVIRGVRDVSDVTILVDDGSSDRTGEVAESTGAIVVRHALNRGQGASLQTGIRCALRAGASYVITFDADGQHQAEDVDALLEPLRAGRAEVTLGSRFLGQSTVPPARRLLLRLATIFTRAASGVAVTDTHNGLRGFTREAAARIEIRQDRMAHASEILDEIRRLELRFVEVPVSIHYSDYSRRKGQSSLGAFRVLWDYLLGRWSR
jgi:polyprenyl-phospho-N-acetylgalactosaminyl synthase